MKVLTIAKRDYLRKRLIDEKFERENRIRYHIDHIGRMVRRGGDRDVIEASRMLVAGHQVRVDLLVRALSQLGHMEDLANQLATKAYNRRLRRLQANGSLSGHA